VGPRWGLLGCGNVAQLICGAALTGKETGCRAAVPELLWVIPGGAWSAGEVLSCCRAGAVARFDLACIACAGTAGGFLGRLAFDAARGRLKETEVQRAIELRNTLTRLGPAYIKLGQVGLGQGPLVHPEPCRGPLCVAGVCWTAIRGSLQRGGQSRGPVCLRHLDLC
jgi:hypothetical protein